MTFAKFTDYQIAATAAQALETGEVMIPAPADCLVFVDLETTGLDPEKDRILEIAILVLRASDLSWPEAPPNVHRGTFRTSFHPEDLVPDPIVRKMHEDSGLLAEICVSEERLLELATPIEHLDGVLHTLEAKCLSFMRSLGFTAGSAVLCGFGPHFDLAFMKRQMPMLAKMFGYRLIDVTALLECDARWRDPNVREAFKKAHEAAGFKKHRALDDCRAAASTLNAYRERWPKPDEEHDRFMNMVREIAGVYASLADTVAAAVSAPVPEPEAPAETP